MEIINTTRIQVSSLEHSLGAAIITQVIYDVENDLTLNKLLTYDQPLLSEIKIQDESDPLLFTVHEVTEKQIRACRVEYKKQTFCAINGQSFTDFLKEQWGIKKTPPQTIAKFHLPRLSLGEEFLWGYVNTHALNFHFIPVPWQVVECFNYEQKIISPIIYSLDYFPNKKQMHAILSYPVNSEAIIFINPGHFNETRQ